jgi:formate-dependent nitrite reductase cytochrome c552 subunit
MAHAGGRATLRVVSLVIFAVVAAGCNRDLAQDHGAPAPSAPAFPVQIHIPAKLTSVEVARGGAQSVRVACVTCHSLRPVKPLPASASELKEFHVGLTLQHGTLGCASCHAPAAPAERLRLADGREIQMVEALSLCSQCHGTQRRSYDHGAHGGMQGHWDLSRGARERNTCVDCHDPHAPKFVGGSPVHPPRDRFFGGPHG